MSKNQFQDAIAAFEHVEKAVAAFKAEHANVVSMIAETESELAAVHRRYLPVEDLKNGILDLVEDAGKRYAQTLRQAAIDFATGKVRDHWGPGELERTGLPLRYDDFLFACDNPTKKLGRAEIMQGAGPLSSHALYFFFSKTILDTMSGILDGITPEELGYGRLKPEDIGSNRSERRLYIDELGRRLTGLRERKAEIEQKLHSIGVPLSVDAKAK